MRNNPELEVKDPIVNDLEQTSEAWLKDQSCEFWNIEKVECD